MSLTPSITGLTRRRRYSTPREGGRIGPRSYPCGVRRITPAARARRAALRRLSRIRPDIEEDLLLNLFHKGARVQWTSEDLDWAPPLRFDDRQREALARLLTPVYFGEQTAMLGASAILPEVA